MRDFIFQRTDNKGKTTVAAMLSIAAIIAVVIVVILFNSGSIKKKNVTQISGTANEDITSDYNSVAGDFTFDSVHVSDLDFYKDFGTSASVNENDIISQDFEEEEIITVENDGHHTKIINKDYSTEWVPISPYISKDEIDYTNLFNQSGRMKYFINDRCVSKCGVFVSKEQGKIDFEKVKKDGIDFVIIRVGQRGYDSGTLSEDSSFAENIKNAVEAGLEIGLSFASYAVNKNEAVEEADYLLNQVKDYSISFPVAVEMQDTKYDKTRTDSLSKDKRTEAVTAFMKKIADSGLIPVLEGNKRQLIKEVDLSKIMAEYDIWLVDTANEIPDYPYRYDLWTYSNSQEVDGITGKAVVIISFNDYSYR